MSIDTWLEQAGLSKYADIFAENEIDEVDILNHLSEEELESLGLPIGARKKLVRALSAQSPPDTPAPSNPTSTPESEVPPEPQETPGTHEAPFSQSDQPPPMAAPEPLSELPSPAAPPASPRIEAKGKNSRRATAILIAVGVHVALILIATTLTIFAASKDEPEIIASIAPPSTSPQQEMKKKTVQKQVKQNPSSASAAAAPMAQMMKANAEAQFTTPDVTRTSTGPLGVGEGDLGTGAFGAGDGLGDAGSGGSFFGTKTSGDLAVIFDITASMYPVVPGVVREINKTFKTSQVVAVFHGGFPKMPTTSLIPYQKNRAVQELVRKNAQRYKKVGIAESMNKALFALQRCDSIEQKSNNQSLGTALEMLVQQPKPPGTVFVLSDFANDLHPGYMGELEKLCQSKQVKVIFWNCINKNKWPKQGVYKNFADAVGGELKGEPLK